MRRRTPEQRFKFNLRKQQKNLDDFIAYETEWSGDLMLWYRCKKIEMPEDEYRACAFFTNKEYQQKPGSLTLMYEAYVQSYRELSEATKENAFDILRYRYRLYAKTLKTGGY